MKIKPLDFKPGRFGVENLVAEGVWGKTLWSSPYAEAAQAIQNVLEGNPPWTP